MDSAQKKPRHRHSPAQLTALNILFDKNEHPPLDIRSALADRLGMEIKTVNAWFQNKRASSKKRSRIPTTATTTNTINSSPPTHIPTRHSPSDDYNDDDSYHHLSRSTSLAPPDHLASSFPSFISDPFTPPDSSDSSNMPICRKLRIRPSQEQTDHLKTLYNTNPHPTSEERQALSEHIGMRYQSITNWFQNQRSLAKKRKGDDSPDSLSNSPSKSDYPNHDMRQYSAFPPPPPRSFHPSLLPHPSLNHDPPSSNLRRSPSLSPSMDDRRSSSRRSTTPYSGALLSRPRRSRPEPYQLDALKDLFTRTSTPTIEERSALALEIGMDVGKVTNWFRNLRQTARKRNNKKSNGRDSEDDMDDHAEYGSGSVSRDRTPSLSTRSSSSGSSSMMEIYHGHRRMEVPHSDEEDDYQSPSRRSISPGPIVRRRSYSHGHEDPYRQSHSGGVREYHGHEHSSHRPYDEEDYDDHHHRHYQHQNRHLNHNQNHNTSYPTKMQKHNDTTAAGIALGRFSATVAIFDEDPRFSAEAAKKYGIDLEDAYLLLDFHMRGG